LTKATFFDKETVELKFLPYLHCKEQYYFVQATCLLACTPKRAGMRSGCKNRPHFLKRELRFLLLPLLLILFMISDLHASQSTIIEADGIACMGYDKSRKQTEEEALANAKKKAVDHAATYIKSESRVKDFELEKDLVEAYSNATVKVIQEISRSWYRDVSLGECCQVKIKAEVIPDNEAMERISKGKGQIEDPSAPLNVQLWTDKKDFKRGDKIKIYIRGNKPFYARILHKGVNGDLVQLLPNPYRKEYYFNGGVIYEIPSGQDRFEMEVTPPFGQEDIIVYASTSRLGEINLAPAGGFTR
jgi:hypothetical protein